MTFAGYIESCLGTPFEWGTHDCVLFVAKWVHHVTGVQYFEGVEAWSDAMGARRMVEDMGGLEKLIDDRLKIKIPVDYANDGDVILVGPRTMGLLNGNLIAVPGPHGLEHLPRKDAKCAWVY